MADRKWGKKMVCIEIGVVIFPTKSNRVETEDGGHRTRLYLGAIIFEGQRLLGARRQRAVWTWGAEGAEGDEENEESELGAAPLLAKRAC